MTLLALGFWPGFAIGMFLGVTAEIFFAALMAAAVAGDDYSYRGFRDSRLATVPPGGLGAVGDA
jgi:hypothetical protein